MRVRILGAGVAGLACAVAMRRRCGFDDVVVLERDTREQAATRVGHGLILMQNAVAALRALGADGLLDEFRVLDRAVVQDDTGAVVESEEMHGVYCVTRAAIVDALRKQLPVNAIEYGRRVVGCDLVPPLPAGRSPRTLRRELRSVAFDRGAPLTNADADLFIGAEGWQSPMYRAINPGDGREESPVNEVVTTSVLPELADRLGSTFLKTVFPGRGLAFGLLSPTPTSVIGFLQFDRMRHGRPGHTTGPGLKAFVTELLAGAPEPIPTYLRLAEFSTAHLWRPINGDVAAGLCGANAVIVGDAAHPLLPFTSQGVGAALEDSLILADALCLLGADLDLLPRTLAGFSDDRRSDMAGFVDGGRRILSHFCGEVDTFVAPYVGGDASKLQEHLALPSTDLASLVALLDTDGDGHMDREDLRHVLDLVIERDVDDGELDALFAEIDADADGLISCEEVIAAVGSGGDASPVLWELRRFLTPRNIGGFAMAQRASLAFRVADRDQDGYIHFADFEGSLGLFGVGGHAAAIRRLFGTVDDDADGRITQAQFLAAIRQGRGAVTAGDEHLFSDDSVNLTTLRQRAYNYRWAVHPPDVIPLTAADCDFPVCAEIISAVQSYLAAGYISYGPNEGLPEFRRVAAETLHARHFLPCTPDTLLPTDGAASAVFLAASFAITEPGDEAIIPDPVDFLLARSVTARGGIVKRWATPGGHYDTDVLESLVTPRTRLLSICNPHNPLGRVLTRRELEAIAEVALRQDLWILSDEVWSDIVYPPRRHVSTASLDPAVAARTFTVTGFSKSYALAGMRLGLVVAPDRDKRDRLMDLAHAGDTVYGASTVSQVAGIAAYEHAGQWLRRFVEHLRRQRDYAVTRLNALDGVSCVTPEGTFVVFPDISGLTADQNRLSDYLLDEFRLAVVPGSPAFFGPGAAGHVRLAFATSRRILAEGLDRFERGVAAWRSGAPLR